MLVELSISAGLKCSSSSVASLGLMFGSQLPSISCSRFIGGFEAEKNEIGPTQTPSV